MESITDGLDKEISYDYYSEISKELDNLKKIAKKKGLLNKLKEKFSSIDIASFGYMYDNEEIEIIEWKLDDALVELERIKKGEDKLLKKLKYVNDNQQKEKLENKLKSMKQLIDKKREEYLNKKNSIDSVKQRMKEYITKLLSIKKELEDILMVNEIPAPISGSSNSYREKYLKYKAKYLKLKTNL